MACPQELARLYTAEIVLAIVHLHKLGFVHRDLKPVRMWTACWFELSCALLLLSLLTSTVMVGAHVAWQTLHATL